MAMVKLPMTFTIVAIMAKIVILAISSMAIWVINMALYRSRRTGSQRTGGQRTRSRRTGSQRTRSRRTRSKRAGRGNAGRRRVEGDSFSIELTVMNYDRHLNNALSIIH